MAVKIIHFSDPHAGGRAEDWLAYFDKRWVGVFNYRFRRRFKHDLSCLQRAVDYILDTRPDVAVCTGDLTSTGQPGEFEKVLEEGTMFNLCPELVLDAIEILDEMIG